MSARNLSEMGSTSGLSGPDFDDESTSDEDEEYDETKHWLEADYLNTVPFADLVDVTNREDLRKKHAVTAEQEAALRYRHPNEVTKPGSDGSTWEYIEYVPVWTDPNWDDNVQIIEVQGRPTTKGPRYAGDLWESTRPAMLLQDQAVNPTSWATRYGIHPDVRAQGRSRLSPTMTQRRRIPLNRTMRTPCGETRDYIDISDLYSAGLQFHRRYGAGGTLDQMLTSLKATAEHQQGSDNAEIAEALVRFEFLFKDDEDYQTTWWDNLISQDLVDSGAICHEDTADSDLTGPLHPLVQRYRWKHANGTGEDPSRPKYYYNLGGRRGWWSPEHDDLVWDVMQPGLQMVSKVLYSQHPAWEAMKNIYNYRRVPEMYDGRTDEAHKVVYPYRLAAWKDIDPSLMVPEARALYEAGFDFKTMLDDYLEKRLVLTLRSNVKPDGTYSAAWAVTNGTLIPPNFDGENPSIELGIDMIWGLLSPHYTRDEKMNMSLVFAASVLHELAHAVHMGICVLTRFARKWASSTLNRIPGGLGERTILDLQALGRCFSSHADFECFYERDAVAEAGFALENQIFGGPILGLFTSDGGTPHLAFLDNVATMAQWPFANFHPHLAGGLGFLEGHYLPVDGRNSVVPLQRTRRFFTEHFYNTEVARFGPVAFRRQPKEIPRMTVAYNWRRRADVARVFGATSWRWMALVIRRLERECQQSIAKYLSSLVAMIMGTTLIRKKWHHEKRTWPRQQDICRAMMGNINTSIANFLQAFTVYTACPEHKHQILQVRIDEHRVEFEQGQTTGPFPTEDSLMREFEVNCVGSWNYMMACFEDFHVFLSKHIQLLQHMTAEYLQLPARDKPQMKNRYVDRLIERIEDFLMPRIRVVQQAVASNRDIIKDANYLTQEMEEMFISIEQALYSDHKLLDATRLLLKSEVGRVYTDLRSRLTATATRSIGSRTRALRKSAMRAYSKLEPTSTAVQAIDRFYELIQEKTNRSLHPINIADLGDMEDLTKQAATLNDVWQKAREQVNQEEVDKIPGRGVFHVPEHIIERREQLSAEAQVQRDREIQGDFPKPKGEGKKSENDDKGKGKAPAAENLPDPPHPFNRPIDQVRTYHTPKRSDAGESSLEEEKPELVGFGRWTGQEIRFPTPVDNSKRGFSGPNYDLNAPVEGGSAFPPAVLRPADSIPLFHAFAGRNITTADLPPQIESTEQIRRNFNILGVARLTTQHASEEAWQAAVRLLAFSGDPEFTALVGESDPVLAETVRNSANDVTGAPGLMAGQIFTPSSAGPPAGAPGVIAVPPRLGQQDSGPGAAAHPPPLAGNLYAAPQPPEGWVAHGYMPTYPAPFAADTRVRPDYGTVSLADLELRPPEIIESADPDPGSSGRRGAMDFTAMQTDQDPFDPSQIHEDQPLTPISQLDVEWDEFKYPDTPMGGS